MKKKEIVLIRKLSLLLMATTISLTIWAQQQISGKVNENNGLPLHGVTIVVKGTTNGTITNVDGEYSISVPSEGILEYSFIGMRTKTEEVSGRAVINVIMESDFDDFVAVGYGTVRKVDITGAVASVKGEQIAASGMFSAGQAMQGKLAGVIITNNGDAGSDSKIRIRGVNTFGDNEPLVVVDGITNGAGLQDINPGDIASIDVLKDASALTIYGIRASNGVILITTKSGSYGKQDLQVSLDISCGIAQVTKRLDLVSSAELVDMIDEARLNDNERLGSKNKTYDEIFFQKDAKGKYILDADGNKIVDQWGRQDVTDWQDELFNTGTVQDYSLSAVGGSENAKYTFSVSYRNQEGTMPGNFAKRYVARGSAETKVMKDKLKIGSTFNYSVRERRGSQQGSLFSSALFNAIAIPGNIPAYDENGVAYQETDVTRLDYFMKGYSFHNPVVNYDDYSNPNHKIVTTLYADFEIFKGLNFKSVLGQNYSQNFYRNYKVQSINPSQDKASSLDVSSGRNMSTSWDNTLTFDKKIGLLGVNALVGTNILNETYNQFEANRVGFPAGDIEGLRYLGFGNPLSQLNNEDAYYRRLASYFGRANLSYADKYLLSATLRKDRSSIFHESVGWGTFPSFSAGWRISEEGFLSSSSWLDYLKIRASWGQVGNQNIGSNYAYASTVSSGYAYYGCCGGATRITDAAMGLPGVRQTGKAIHDKGNLGTTWETTTMQNIGFDFTVLGVDGSFDVYQNNTVGMLLNAEYPQLAGYYPGSSIKINAGEVETKGFEFNLNYGGNAGDFTYNIIANFTYSNNKILSLGDIDYIQQGGMDYKEQLKSMSRAYVGDAIGSFYGYNIVGIFNTQEEVDAANENYRAMLLADNPELTPKDVKRNNNFNYYLSSKTGPGDYIFEDVDGNGIMHSYWALFSPYYDRFNDDIKNLGSGNPRVQFGLNFSCNYKAIDFALILTGVTGVEIYSMLEPQLSIPGYFNTLSSVKEHWTPDNHTDVNPRYTIEDFNRNLRPSSKWIHDGSYLRFQNLVLGYTLAENGVSKVGLSNLRLFVNIQNLYTITNYPFLEPEVQGLSGANLDVTAGVDTGVSPIPRTIMLGLNVNF